ncbi:MAG: flagellar biosynthetic protein FliO [Deltaproteobacteria bacterium]|nr:flagellar biosynthetic protein FliO [Deltaproteobacteria bacterium]
MSPLTPSGSPEIAWPVIAAVLLLTAAATLVHWWLKGRGLLPTAANPIRVVAMRSLGGKKAVAVVEVEAQRFLLGLTDDAVSLLSQLPGEAKAPASGTVVALPAGARR